MLTDLNFLYDDAAHPATLSLRPLYDPDRSRIHAWISLTLREISKNLPLAFWRHKRSSR